MKSVIYLGEQYLWYIDTLRVVHMTLISERQGYIFCKTCSYPELTKDHVLTSAYVKILRTVTRNAINKSVWRKKDCSWPPINKYAMNIWLSSLRIRAHLSWRTGKHLHVLHVHVLGSWILGYHNLCSPESRLIQFQTPQPPSFKVLVFFLHCNLVETNPVLGLFLSLESRLQVKSAIFKIGLLSVIFMQ